MAGAVAHAQIVLQGSVEKRKDMPAQNRIISVETIRKVFAVNELA